MRKILHLTINDLRIFFSSRGNLVSLLLLPVVMTLLVGVFSSGNDGEPTSVRIDLLDQDNSPLSAQLIESIRRANRSLLLCPMDNDNEDRCLTKGVGRLDIQQATARVAEGTTHAAVVIPQGFSSDVQNFEPVNIVVYAQEEFGAPGYVEQALEAAIQKVNGAAVAARTGAELITAHGLTSDSENQQGFARAVYKRAAEVWQREPVRIAFEFTSDGQSDAVGFSLQEGLGQSVPGMGSMFVMFTVFGGMTALIVERKQWTLQRLAVAPISRTQLLGGKILARFSLGILQFMVVFGVGIFAGINLGESPLALILVVTSYTLAITALSFALGSWLQNEAQASGFSLLLSLVLAPLGGAWWPLEVVPNFMRVIGHLSPVAWAMDSFQALISNQGGLPDVLLPVLVLFGIAVLSFAWGIRRFQYVDA